MSTVTDESVGAAQVAAPEKKRDSDTSNPLDHPLVCIAVGSVVVLIVSACRYFTLTTWVLAPGVDEIAISSAIQTYSWAVAVSALVWACCTVVVVTRFMARQAQIKRTLDMVLRKLQDGEANG